MVIRNVYVVGSGFMGNGIAQVSALAGYQVRMSDLGADRLETGVDEIKRSLGILLSKEKITPGQYEKALENLSTTTDLEDARDADLVVEAVPEDLDLKKAVFSRLDGICPAHAILATNTSALPISAIAAATGRPDRVVGTHFFGPVPLMRLCEIIRGLLTSQDTLDAANSWAQALGKETVLVCRDIAGFIANRVMIPASLEAVRMVDEGMASPEEIDVAVSSMSGGGVGPMQIMDNAGIDVSLAAASAIYEDTGEKRFFPPPLMRRMVAAGLLGRKSGKGFYDYTGGKRASYELVRTQARKVDDGTERAGRIFQQFLLPAILEALRLLEQGVAVAEDIDRAVCLGFNFPLGPLAIADSMGLDTVMNAAAAFFDETGESRFRPPALLRRMVGSGLES